MKNEGTSPCHCGGVHACHTSRAGPQGRSRLGGAGEVLVQWGSQRERVQRGRASSSSATVRVLLARKASDHHILHCHGILTENPPERAESKAARRTPPCCGCPHTVQRGGTRSPHPPSPLLPDGAHCIRWPGRQAASRQPARPLLPGEPAAAAASMH